jgi:hypothetical protein
MRCEEVWAGRAPLSLLLGVVLLATSSRSPTVGLGLGVLGGAGGLVVPRGLKGHWLDSGGRVVGSRLTGPRAVVASKWKSVSSVVGS